jgi:hypothetical protein
MEDLLATKRVDKGGSACGEGRAGQFDAVKEDGQGVGKCYLFLRRRRPSSRIGCPS